NDQSGSATLLVQIAPAPPMVALWVVARLKTADCQPEPFQYRPSLPRCRVKVVLLALRPTPPLLSATLPLNLAGTLLGPNERLPPGLITEVRTGAVLSRMKLTAVPVKLLPTRSVAVAWMV